MMQRKNQKESWSGISGGLSGSLAPLCDPSEGSFLPLLVPHWYLYSIMGNETRLPSVLPSNSPGSAKMSWYNRWQNGNQRKKIYKESKLPHFLLFILTILPQSSVVRPILSASLLFEVIFII